MIRHGLASVRRCGVTYEGFVELERTVLTFHGRSRRVLWLNGEPTVEYGAPTVRTWPVGKVDEVEWARA